jgi:hypothetical protein
MYVCMYVCMYVFNLMILLNVYHYKGFVFRCQMKDEFPFLQFLVTKYCEPLHNAERNLSKHILSL